MECARVAFGCYTEEVVKQIQTTEWIQRVCKDTKDKCEAGAAVIFIRALLDVGPTKGNKKLLKVTEHDIDGLMHYVYVCHDKSFAVVMRKLPEDLVCNCVVSSFSGRMRKVEAITDDGQTVHVKYVLDQESVRTLDFRDEVHEAAVDMKMITINTDVKLVKEGIVLRGNAMVVNDMSKVRRRF